MSSEITGSTVPRRQLGRYLKDLRMTARLTVKAAATALEWSEGKIWRIETGQSSMRSHDAELMCKIYGADAETTDALKALARESKARGWWHSYGEVIPEYFDVFLGLEEAASSIASFDAQLVPGLLQTGNYARTIFLADNPGHEAAEIERRVHVRLARQVLLTRVTARPTLRFALSESVLHRPIGSVQVLLEQLDHLVEVSDLDNVAIRIVPFAAGLHPGILSGPFIMLGFGATSGGVSEPPTIYVEGFTGALYLDKAAEVERYETAFQGIWDKSLNEASTRDLVSKTARELRG